MKAFPNNRSEGMDLRDYFAAAALTGIYDKAVSEGLPPDQIAVACYMMAEAMMKERENDNQAKS